MKREKQQELMERRDRQEDGAEGEQLDRMVVRQAARESGCTDSPERLQNSTAAVRVLGRKTSRQAERRGVDGRSAARQTESETGTQTAAPRLRRLRSESSAIAAAAGLCRRAGRKDQNTTTAGGAGKLKRWN